MKRFMLAAATALAALWAPAAFATPTSTLVVQGSGLEFFYYGVPGRGCYEGGWDWPLCQESEAPVTWSGVLQIVTSSQADGVYTGADLESIVFSSSIGAFIWHGEDQDYCGFSCENLFTGMVPGASVTIADGRVTSMDFTYDFQTGAFVAGGLGVAENPASYGHASSIWWVTGSATPVTEPISASLMLAGLGLLCQRRRAAPVRPG